MNARQLEIRFCPSKFFSALQTYCHIYQSFCSRMIADRLIRLDRIKNSRVVAMNEGGHHTYMSSFFANLSDDNLITRLISSWRLTRPILFSSRYMHYTHTNFSQPSNRIALVYQAVYSRTVADQLYYDWIAGNFLDGYDNISSFCIYLNTERIATIEYFCQSDGLCSYISHMITDDGFG